MASKYSCRHCSQSYVTITNYIDHQQVHSLNKNASFLCPFVGCSQRLTSSASFYSHKKLSHSGFVRENFSKPGEILSESTWQCPAASCSQYYHQRKELMDCIRAHIRSGLTVSCPFIRNSLPCSNTFSSCKVFNTHVCQYHQFVPAPVVNLPGLTVTEGHPAGEASVSDVSEFDMGLPGHDSNEEIEDVDPFPSSQVKDHVAKFYLKLEGEAVLPSTTVQFINEDVAGLLRMSHHSVKRSLHEEFSLIQLSEDQHNKLKTAVDIALRKDPVFSVHHRALEDPTTRLYTAHLRKEWVKRQGKYVEPIEYCLGKKSGRNRYAQHVPIAETLKVLFSDPSVQKVISLSFRPRGGKSQDVLEDYRDGLLFQEDNIFECIDVLLYHDAFDFNPYSASVSLHRPHGFYFTLGNFPPEYRSKVDACQLAFMITTEDLKFFGQPCLKPLIKELRDLCNDGVVFQERRVKFRVPLMLGDNEGSHFIGGFTTGFTAHYVCRYCELSSKSFADNPTMRKPLRTPETYDACVRERPPECQCISLDSDDEEIHEENESDESDEDNEDDSDENVEINEDGEDDSDENVEINEDSESEVGEEDLFEMVEEVIQTSDKHYLGVVQASILNQIPNFHVCQPALPPCLAHDLFEGVVRHDLALIISSLISKGWFTHEALNHRLSTFVCKGGDSANAFCRKLKKPLKKIPGSATQVWCFLRMLPFIIGDWIKDTNDEVWQLYLTLKRLVELVCPPSIAQSQIIVMQGLIDFYLAERKRLFPTVPLRPKHHYLCHYPELTLIFGPLIRLWTLRFESFHKLFKKAGKAANNFINITHTLASKYQLNFAYRNSGELFGSDVSFDHSVPFDVMKLKPEVRDLVGIDDASQYLDLPSVTFKGSYYTTNLFLVLDRQDSPLGLQVGEILSILYDGVDLFVLLKVSSAENYFDMGVYEIVDAACTKISFMKLKDISSYFPLASYKLGLNMCLSLKHTSVCMAPTA